MKFDRIRDALTHVVENLIRRGHKYILSVRGPKEIHYNQNCCFQVVAETMAYRNCELGLTIHLPFDQSAGVTPELLNFLECPKIPLVGGPADLVRNWANGYPSTWSEIGWAGLDLVDGSLLVLSLGASAEVTAAKEAAKQGGKAAVKNIARTEAAELLVKQAAPRALPARSLARTTTSALRRVVAISTKAGRLAGEVVVVGGRVVRSAGTQVTKTARAVLTTWVKIPPQYRRLVYGGLLDAGLLCTVQHRGWPDPSQAAEDIGNKIGELVEGTARFTAEALAAAVKEVLRPPTLWEWRHWLAYLGPPLLLVLGACTLRPARKKIRYA